MKTTTKTLPKIEDTSIKMDFATEDSPEGPALLLSLLDQDGNAITGRVNIDEVKSECGCWGCTREALYAMAEGATTCTWSERDAEREESLRKGQGK